MYPIHKASAALPLRAAAAFCLAILLAPCARAAVPGEDTIVLDRPVHAQGLPTAPQPRSAANDGPTDMPAWMRARMARYESIVFAVKSTTEVQTNNDVVATAQAQGLKKVCVQEVGSSSAAAAGGFQGYGPKGGKEQVVVLRGDLVNVCR